MSVSGSRNWGEEGTWMTVTSEGRRGSLTMRFQVSPEWDRMGIELWARGDGIAELESVASRLALVLPGRWERTEYERNQATGKLSGVLRFVNGSELERAVRMVAGVRGG